MAVFGAKMISESHATGNTARLDALFFFFCFWGLEGHAARRLWNGNTSQPLSHTQQYSILIPPRKAGAFVIQTLLRTSNEAVS